MKASTDSEKANLFNVYFSNIVTDVHYKFFVPSLLQIYVNKTLSNDKNSICLSLQSIKMTQSWGPDQLSPILFKRTSESICNSLKNLFLNIKRLKKFPDEWKKGIVSPMYKKNNKADILNYRPVALLNFVSKIFEKFFFQSHC